MDSKPQKRVIIHFQPLEYYPPVQNLIRYLTNKYPEQSIIVLTTRIAGEASEEFDPGSGYLKIVRAGRSGGQMKTVARYLNYLLFYLASLFQLLKNKPASVLYFETLSSFPVYIYKRYFRHAVRVLIHYHEYTTPREYQAGMKLSRYFHKKEKWLYSCCNWLSHTNAFRMEKFKEDLKPLKISNACILPNYPPEVWNLGAKSRTVAPLKIVYVGALNHETMYVDEFANWVLAQKGNVLWDIFPLNISNKVIDHLTQMKSQWINLKRTVKYEDLPGILRQYDIGVVLYKGHIPNYVWNAPNKLFEYLACGLDVWFPDVMEGSLQYVTSKTYPKVLAIDFSDLEMLDIEAMKSREGLSYLPGNYYCEQVLPHICRELLNLPVAAA